MAQVETEKLTQILWGAALSRAVCTIAELGIADQIEAGSPQSVESLAGATGTHERSLYRILRFLDSHGIFQEKGNRQFDHTPLSHCLRSCGCRSPRRWMPPKLTSCTNSTKVRKRPHGGQG